ncbi:MAG: recombinase family protein [bacterium]|nr:recombinase family protein [bacterium]
MKAIILARVSDKKQDSNEAQVVRVSDYVKFKGLTVWKTVEIEESSTKGDREKFQEVIKVIQDSKEIIALVVDTVDRLQRSFKESVQLDELRRAGKIEIHFYRENLVIHKDSNSSDILRWDMAVMFAKSYVLQLSDNVKRKQKHMLSIGELIGKPPIGYESMYDENGKRIDVVFDPIKAHLIKKMFELYATGNHSTLTIRDLILKEGLKSSVGKPLALSMIDHILNNTFYYGIMVSKKKSYPHKYQPLITKELFDKCQRIRKGWHKKPFAYASKPFILRGLVRCGKCGCSMSPYIKKEKYIYYSCSNGKKDICSTKICIREEALLEPIYEVLEAFNSIPQEKIDKLIEGLKQSSNAKNLYHRNTINTLQSEYNSTQTRIDRLMDLLIDSSITKDDYDKKLKELKDKQYDINIQLDEHTKADESYYITASTVFNLAKDAMELFESSEVLEKRAIVNYLLSNYTINEKTPCITMRSPFKELLSLATQPMGLGR